MAKNSDGKDILRLTPKWKHDETRCKDIAEEIEKHLMQRRTIPDSWVAEYNQLVTNEYFRKTELNP